MNKKKLLHLTSEAFFGLLWGIVIAMIVIAPGTLSGAVDFVYANF